MGKIGGRSASGGSEVYVQSLWPRTLSDFLFVVESLFGGFAIGVEVSKAFEENEAAQSSAGSVQQQVLQELPLPWIHGY